MAAPIFELDPNTQMKIRWSAVLERLLEAESWPQDTIVPEDVYQDLVEYANKQAMMEKLVEMGATGAKAIPSLQKPTESNSPLAELSRATPEGALVRAVA
jgi:hypothetical protein